MKEFLSTVSAIIAALGSLVGLLGVVMIAYGIFAPLQPPPSLNEGQGYAFALGIVVACIGVTAVVVGRALDPLRKGARASDESGDDSGREA